jgi:uncharacterized membrane protein
MPAEPAVNFHGYLRTRSGEYFPIDFPGHTNTIPQRITDTGVILGCRHDADLMSTMRGVTIDTRDTSQASDIGVFASMNNGATPDGGVIVGLYTDMETGKGRAYLLYGDTVVSFDVPGSTFTAGWDMNPRGDVVGVYRDAENKVHGFRWAALAFASIDYPAATATRAFGINSRGDIVGAYLDAANRSHGFVVVNRD